MEERVTARKELAVVRRAADEPPPGTPESAKRRVARYYDGMQFLYSSLWSSSGVHYGFWEPGTRSRAQAIRNMDRLVACELALPLGSRVLDAGCGVGGTSMLLAEEHGLDVVGITISDDQLERARCAAAASPARARLRFAHADFLATGFEDASFDGVVGVESVCYAESKSAFLAEAWRVLRPGGRLVVLDGFRQRTALTPRDARDLRRFVSGWALSGLAFVGEFDAALHAAGFESVDYSDKRRAVMPSAWLMEGIAWIGFWSIGLACWLEVLPRLWLDHGLACLSQRRLFQRETLTYGVFTARKPRATNPGS